MVSHVRNIGFAVQAFQVVLCGVLAGLCFSVSAWVPAGITLGAMVIYVCGIIGAAKFLKWLLVVYGIFSLLWCVFCIILILLYEQVISVALPEATFGDVAAEIIADRLGNVSLQTMSIVIICIYAVNAAMALIGTLMAFILFKHLYSDDVEQFDRTIRSQHDTYKGFDQESHNYN